MVTVFCKPEITVGIARLPEFSGDDGVLSGRVTWHHLTNRDKESMMYCNGQQRPNSNKHSLSHKALWHWLTDYGIPRHKSGGQCIRRKSPSLVSRSLT